MLNPRLGTLPDYPFRRLAALLEGIVPGQSPIDLSIGEPQHPTPPLVREVLACHADLWRAYPPAAGTPRWKAAVTDWLTRRYALPQGMIDPAAVIPASGTREALYMVGQLVIEDVPGPERPLVLMPDPSYLPYLGATLMNGAQPVAVPATEASGFLPDFTALPEATLARARLMFLCSPANPQGALVSLETWKQVITLARAHDIVLVADECYSEIYDAAPPTGVLEACRELGGSLANVLVLNSLSKRSNAAGLRSGFIAGDPTLVAAFLRLRAYGGAGLPLPVQEASAALWDDEAHVEANRALYRAKITLAAQHLADHPGFFRPAGGFFLWLDARPWGDTGEAAALRLWREVGLKTLPGATMSPDPGQKDTPGRHRLRVALVPETAVLAQALARLDTVRPG
nr:aminotransferase class I/II-fold pyridoxal phosphate-dependent enzyme [Pararhodospirillum photometricum]